VVEGALLYDPYHRERHVVTRINIESENMSTFSHGFFAHRPTISQHHNCRCLDVEMNLLFEVLLDQKVLPVTTQVSQSCTRCFPFTRETNTQCHMHKHAETRFAFLLLSSTSQTWFCQEITHHQSHTKVVVYSTSTQMSRSVF